MLRSTSELNLKELEDEFERKISIHIISLYVHIENSGKTDLTF